MTNYFDNQDKWSWHVSQEDKTASITTDHGTHTHTLEVGNISIGEIVENTGQVMGDAHRAASHDFKEINELSKTMENDVTVSEAVEQSQSSVDESESIQNDEECEDGIDF